MALLFIELGFSSSALGSLGFMVIIPVFILAFYCFCHAATNRKLPTSHRFVWIGLILVAPLIGSFAYLLIGRKHEARQYKLLGIKEPTFSSL